MLVSVSVGVGGAWVVGVGAIGVMVVLAVTVFAVAVVLSVALAVSVVVVFIVAEANRIHHCLCVKAVNFKCLSSTRNSSGLCSIHHLYQPSPIKSTITNHQNYYVLFWYQTNTVSVPCFCAGATWYEVSLLVACKVLWRLPELIYSYGPKVKPMNDLTYKLLSSSKIRYST